MQDPSWWNVIVSWFPFVLLIAFWIFFMFALKKGGVFKEQREHMKRNQLHMERTEALLERIAVAVEGRPQDKT